MSRTKVKNTVILLLFTGLSFGQFHKTDSVGNFYVSENKLIWEKYFLLEDINELDKQLKNNNFSSNLDILRFTKSTKSNLTQLTANNLPQYAQNDFEAFIVVNIIGDQYRIIIKDITFPKFIESYYFNGRKEYTGRGTLGYYLLRADRVIKRNNGTYHVMDSFDQAFMEIFSPNIDGY